MLTQGLPGARSIQGMELNTEICARPPKGRLGVFGGIVLLSQLGVRAAGIGGVGVRDAAKHLSMQKTASTMTDFRPDPPAPPELPQVTPCGAGVSYPAESGEMSGGCCCCCE